MSIQQFSSSKTSVESRSSNDNEDGSFSLSCTDDERTRFLCSPWISRLCPQMPQPISCKEPEQDTDKRLAVSPFFQCQQQMAAKFPMRCENNIKSYQEPPLVDHLAASSSQLVAERVGSASHDRGGIPAAKSTFGELVALQQSTSQLHQGNKQTAVGILSEEEEPFSSWNLGRLGRSNFVSSASPLRDLTMANGRKRSRHIYDLVPSKLRKLDSEED